MLGRRAAMTRWGKHGRRYDRSQIADFCLRHGVSSFALFGSILRRDFNPRSDVDVLVVFAKDAPRSFMKLVTMTRELELMFGRPVDLCTKSAVLRSESRSRKNEILKTAKEIYAEA